LPDSSLIHELRQDFRGELVTPHDFNYDAERRVWNGMIDKKPAIIAKCLDTHDVTTCVNVGRNRNVLISIRGGGHNYAGKAVCDNGLVIDLSRMKKIRVDPDNQTAEAEAGLRLGEFDRETQRFGLATTLGVNTDTGISGLTLGGGYGWLGGKYGLACDNLIGAEMVTADGDVLQCDEDRNADLFWGLRGAGANFGVVTKLRYKLHPLTRVVGGLIIQSLNKDTLQFFDEFSNTAPDELTTSGAVLTAPDGKPAFGTLVCFCGNESEGLKILEPLIKFEKPIANFIQPREYLDMQTQMDAVWPPGRHYYNKAHNIRTLNDGAIQTILHFSLSLPTAVSNIAMQQLHGTASRVSPTATAFPHRYNHFTILAHPATDEPAEDQKIIQWSRDCWEALQPFVEKAVYVNVLEDAQEEGELRVREAYGPNYGRLSSLKRKYDPHNLFRQNSNIKPA
jgi:FAD/FMN-containing dehydrogenase